MQPCIYMLEMNQNGILMLKQDTNKPNPLNENVSIYQINNMTIYDMFPPIPFQPLPPGFKTSLYLAVNNTASTANSKGRTTPIIAQCVWEMTLNRYTLFSQSPFIMSIHDSRIELQLVYRENEINASDNLNYEEQYLPVKFSATEGYRAQIAIQQIIDY